MADAWNLLLAYGSQDAFLTGGLTRGRDLANQISYFQRVGRLLPFVRSEGPWWSEFRDSDAPRYIAEARAWAREETSAPARYEALLEERRRKQKEDRAGFVTRHLWANGLLVAFHGVFPREIIDLIAREALGPASLS